MGNKRCFNKRGMDPALGRSVVSAVARARRERPCRPRHYPGNCGMTPAQFPRFLQSLIERAKDHREHGPEGARQTANGVGEDLRMVGHGSCDPWMGELQQQGAPSPEKKHSLSIYSPSYRVRA
jgi:hypothetical protein